MRPALRFPVTVVFALSACALPALASPGVEWVVRSNGFPGTRAGSNPSPQLLSASGPRLRILDPGHARVVYLDLAGQRWVEAQPLDRTYTVTPFQEVEARRARELAHRARAVAQVARRQARLLDRDDAEGARALEREALRAGLRLDGQPDQVTLERPQERREATVWVDGRPRQVTLERYLIRVNQAAAPACELWITEDLTLPVDLLDFYRAAGLFHPGVAQRLAEVPGVVIEAVARLEQGALRREVTTQVLRLRTQVEVPEADLIQPPGFTPRPAAGEADAGEVCAHCGEPLAPDAPRYKALGRVYCSSGHRRDGFAR